MVSSSGSSLLALCIHHVRSPNHQQHQHHAPHFLIAEASQDDLNCRSQPLQGNTSWLASKRKAVKQLSFFNESYKSMDSCEYHSSLMEQILALLGGFLVFSPISFQIE